MAPLVCTLMKPLSCPLMTASPPLCLMQVLSRRGAARVLVFCNKIETCRMVENHLARSDRLGSKYKVRLGGAR